jgi:hypothetical protein
MPEPKPNPVVAEIFRKGNAENMFSLDSQTIEKVRKFFQRVNLDQRQSERFLTEAQEKIAELTEPTDNNKKQILVSHFSDYMKKVFGDHFESKEIVTLQDGTVINIATQLALLEDEEVEDKYRQAIDEKFGAGNIFAQLILSKFNELTTLKKAYINSIYGELTTEMFFQLAIAYVSHEIFATSLM